MTVAFAVLLVVHGLIHLLGAAKSFRWAELRDLSQLIPPIFGALWLLAAILFFTAAVALFIWPRWWWAIGACAVLVSMVLVVHFWTDARFGAIGNVAVFAGVVFGFFAQGPVSLRAAYDGDVARSLARIEDAAPVTEADLDRLPAPVQRYLRGVGVVGLPRVHNFHVRMHGRIRSGRAERWMPLTAEQYNFVNDPARLFYFTASMFMLPVQGFHRYVGSAATMMVKAAALVPVVDASGAEMNEGETVTMFNDMCVIAPATLIDPAVRWEPIDDRSARATFANAGHTIRADLSFNAEGELTNFWSEDRYQSSPDGKTMTKLRWSTPLRAYRQFGPVRLASGGEARWHDASGDYTYIELTFDDVGYNRRTP